MALGQGPGGTNVPSNINQYYDALLSTTLENFNSTLFDNIFKDSAFLSFIRMKDSWKELDGGDRIGRTLMYGDNSTVKTHGGYSTIDTTPQDGITKAFYEWAEIAGTISISRAEQRKNSGESKIIDLLASKTRQAEMTMREKINGDLIAGTVSSATFVPDTAEEGQFGLYPLGYFLRKANATDPVSGGNVGNIAASNAWWRHHTAVLDSASLDTGNSFAMNVSTYSGLKAALRRMYNYCGRGSGGFPDVVLTDQVTFETYENALDSAVRFTNTRMGELGFDTVKLRGATMMWDEVVPDIDNGTAAITAGTAFFVNTDFYEVVYDSMSNIVTTPFVEALDQTASAAKILFMGQSAVTNLRKHGVCYGIAQNITA